MTNEDKGTVMSNETKDANKVGLSRRNLLKVLAAGMLAGRSPVASPSAVSPFYRNGYWEDKNVDHLLLSYWKHKISLRKRSGRKPGAMCLKSRQ